VQVLRAQPGDRVTLFNGAASLEWPARILRMSRHGVEVQVGAAVPVDRELGVAVTLALGVPANDRMDGLIEKAGELGASAIQPLVCERSVLRVAEARAEAKQRHWSAVAAAASEQCGRVRVTTVLPIRPLLDWLDDLHAPGAIGSGKGGLDLVLSFAAGALPPGAALAAAAPAVRVLSGPEGGLTAAEERVAVERGFVRVGLGPRVLRADTAPLALLAWLGLHTAKAPDEPRPRPARALPGLLPDQQRHLHRHQRAGRPGAGA
jgi:16S rRNA (uracil1498-N3)-methyltransferase